MTAAFIAHDRDRFQRVAERHFAIMRLVTKSYGTAFTKSKALSRRRTEIGTGSTKPMGQVMVEQVDPTKHTTRHRIITNIQFNEQTQYAE